MKTSLRAFPFDPEIHLDKEVLQWVQALGEDGAMQAYHSGEWYVFADDEDGYRCIYVTRVVASTDHFKIPKKKDHGLVPE